MSFSDRIEDPRKYDPKEDLKKALESGDSKQVLGVIKKVEEKVKMANRRMDRSEAFQKALEEVARAFLEVVYEEIRDELKKD